jgi:hypothetical protein
MRVNIVLYKKTPMINRAGIVNTRETKGSRPMYWKQRKLPYAAIMAREPWAILKMPIIPMIRARPIATRA